MTKKDTASFNEWWESDGSNMASRFHFTVEVMREAYSAGIKEGKKVAKKKTI